jgi:hypothetical protein
MSLVHFGSRANIPSPTRAAQVSAASLSLLSKSGLHFEEITEGHFHVAGGFTFWPATGYWRSHDGKAKGYSARALIALAKAAVQ